MHQLQSLILDAEKYKLIKNNTNPNTEIYIDSLVNKAKELNIFDLTPFYNSSLFRNHGLQCDLHRGVILKTYL